MNLRKLAKGQACMIRLPGVCNGNQETTVLCHYRLIGVSGLGMKSPDILAAWGCSACHAHVDTHHDAETRLAHCEGVFRTLAKLKQMGISL